MTDGSWVATRVPRPPEELAETLEGRVGSLHGAADPETLVAGLAAAAAEGLERALERPGRVRDSAYELLAADALLTLACEAALESGDPDGLLDRVLSDGVPT